MKNPEHLLVLSLGLSLVLGAGMSQANPKSPTPPALAGEAKKLQEEMEAALETAKARIGKSLPKINDAHRNNVEKARVESKEAQALADAAAQDLGRINSGKALVEHARKKWIAGAEKGIAEAEAALKKATNAGEREAANKALAHWTKNKQDGQQALKERQAALDKALAEEPKLKKTHEQALANLAKAKAAEAKANQVLFASLDGFLNSDKLDNHLVKAAVLTDATPRGLAEFSSQGSAEKALADQLLADPELMKEMLVAGGAKFGKYGNAMRIYTAIQAASSKASSGEFQRLALATSLEHAVPIALSKFADRPDGPGTVDPVRRYLHYEKAYLDGELDPAFKNFTTWEYRHVVNSEAPDEILAWGREMLRTYRPDHITMDDYGWRYVSSVRTDVAYGSQNVKNDLPSLHQFQNIMKNGGVCGRRAFFGRFILRAFGIPTWGVTQKAHAALSHWTPKGWVINLGAGFHASWWDKDEVPMSGTQFLMDTQARAHSADYLRVLRAQWVSRILGEPAFNDRKKIEGGFWSNLGQNLIADIGSKAVTLGPLGQELGEANEKEQKVKSEAVSASDQLASVKDGIITIPSVAHGATAGKAAAMKSHSQGMQIHAFGGFKTDYSFDAPEAGKYELTLRVATVQDGQIFIISAGDNGSPTEIPVPYTTGLWQETAPITVELEKGGNTLLFQLKEGSRGVTIKDLTLKPVS